MDNPLPIILEGFQNNLPLGKIATQTGVSLTTLRSMLDKWKNGKEVHYRKQAKRKHYCQCCGETRGEKFFGHRKNLCRQCLGEKSITMKKRAIEYLGGECLYCSYKGYYGAMDFHHRDPNEKECDWGALRHKTWDKITVELDKCDLVCCRCHAEIHGGYRLPITKVANLNQ